VLTDDEADEASDTPADGVVAGQTRVGADPEKRPTAAPAGEQAAETAVDSEAAGASDEESASAEETADDEAAEDGATEEDVPDRTTDLSIMTNEERVQYLLAEHDGRMLQSDIVEAADWSKATVSRVLSRMEEEGTVSRVDIGKGNLVSRPEDEPASADSPFSE
jgi:uncharacterized membrane protein